MRFSKQRYTGHKPKRVWVATCSLLTFALVLAACGDNGDPEDSPDTAADVETDDEEPEPEDTGNEVPPLDDGFPDEAFTMWNAFDPGHTDDLFNQTVSNLGREISPVGIQTESQPQGPVLQYGLVDFLETQPRWEEGYHVYAISYFGSSLRPDTVDLLADRDLEDLKPINSMVEAPFVMAINPDDDRFSTVEEVEEWARENPGELTTVGSSAGSGLHSTLLVWASEADIEIDFLPTDGAGESRNVLLGGGADLGMLTYDPGMDDQVDLIAQTGDTSMSTLPDVPTTADLGYNIPAGSFRGVATMPEVPDEVIEWYADFFERIADMPEFADEMEGLDIVYRGPEETAELRQDIRDTFIPVLEEHGLTEN